MDLFYILLQPVASAIIVIIFAGNLILIPLYVLESDLSLAERILSTRIIKKW